MPLRRSIDNSAFSRLPSSLGDIDDELIADMVAERVVDVLEMIKINVKHRGGWAAIVNLGNSAFEPLSEINAVGQSAKGIAQRKFAQLPLADRNRGCSSPHLAHDNGDREYERDNGERDEGKDAGRDCAAGLCRLPGQADNGIAVAIGEVDNTIPGCWCERSVIRRPSICK